MGRQALGTGSSAGPSLAHPHLRGEPTAKGDPLLAAGLSAVRLSEAGRSATPSSSDAAVAVAPRSLAALPRAGLF